MCVFVAIFTVMHATDKETFVSKNMTIHELAVRDFDIEFSTFKFILKNFKYQHRSSQQNNALSPCLRIVSILSNFVSGT